MPHLLMNRLNNTESGIFIFCIISLLLTDPLFRTNFIFTAADVKCMCDGH